MNNNKIEKESEPGEFTNHEEEVRVSAPGRAAVGHGVRAAPAAAAVTSKRCQAKICHVETAASESLKRHCRILFFFLKNLIKAAGLSFPPTYSAPVIYFYS